MQNSECIGSPLREVYLGDCSWRAHASRSGSISALLHIICIDHLDLQNFAGMALFVGLQQHHTARDRTATAAAHQRSTPDNVSHVLFIQIRFSHDVYFLSILNWFSVRLPLGRAHIGDAALLQTHLGV